jgi:hypothetical protein
MSGSRLPFFASREHHLLEGGSGRVNGGNDRIGGWPDTEQSLNWRKYRR